MAAFSADNTFGKFKWAARPSLLAILSFQPLVNAQTAKFTGLTVEAATGYQSMTISADKLTVVGIPIPAPSVKIDGVPYALNVSYIFGVSESATVGVRFEYNPLTSRYAAVVLPGYAISERTQSYLRFGWAQMASTIDVPSTLPQKLEATFRGPTIGAGAKYRVFDNFYVYAELNYYQYNDINFSDVIPLPGVSGTAKSSAQNFLIGVGYRFD